MEIGAGTGVHGLFFKESGIKVLSTDLSENMVEACREAGLEALRVDFLSMSFDSEFDAVFAMNCLLHVPPIELSLVLKNVARTLRPGGLFYWGQYGGVKHEGPVEQDDYEPKRYYSFLANNEMCQFGVEKFDLIDFETIELKTDWEQNYQSSVWQLAG